MTRQLTLQLNNDIAAHLERIVFACSGISEIWLIGSRAIDEGGSDSDWDFIVFADGPTMMFLQDHREFARPDVDLLVIYGHGTRFQSPWIADKGDTVYKRGSLEGWKWQLLSPTESHYKGEGFDNENCKDVRVYSREDRRPTA